MWLSLMKPITLRPVSVFDLAGHLYLHDPLPAPAQVKHGLSLPGVRERLLTAREGVLQHDEDCVGAERRLGFCGPPAGCPGELAHDRIRDRGRERPVAGASCIDRSGLFGAHGVVRSASNRSRDRPRGVRRTCSTIETEWRVRSAAFSAVSARFARRSSTVPSSSALSVTSCRRQVASSIATCLRRAEGSMSPTACSHSSIWPGLWFQCEGPEHGGRQANIARAPFARSSRPHLFRRWDERPSVVPGRSEPMSALSMLAHAREQLLAARRGHHLVAMNRVHVGASQLEQLVGHGRPGGVTAAARLMKALSSWSSSGRSDRSTPIARPPLSSPRVKKSSRRMAFPPHWPLHVSPAGVKWSGGRDMQREHPPDFIPPRRTACFPRLSRLA